MSKSVVYITFKLKKDASVPDFIKAAEKLNKEHISKLKGFISWQQLNDGKVWADYITFETMEDAKNLESGSSPQVAKEFYAFINLFTCKVHYYKIEKEHQ